MKQESRIHSENTTQWLLITVAVGFLALFLVVPLALILTEAFKRGWSVYHQSLTDPYTLSAIGLTFFVTVIVVPLNTIFGIAAAWCIAKFRFRGRQLLMTLIDIPYSVSPVISGLIFILLFGRQGWFGDWLAAHHISIIFAFPGIVLATLFVTFPMVAKELIPLMESQGNEEEEAARLLGATGWQTFRYVTLPNIRWGLLYGILLCNSRALGEFGAVAVVSGSLRGETTTIPLHIEILYNEYQITAAFSVASLLTLTAIITLIIKSFLEWKQNRTLTMLPVYDMEVPEIHYSQPAMPVVSDFLHEKSPMNHVQPTDRRDSLPLPSTIPYRGRSQGVGENEY
ncbi:MAG: sulfate ABC transporter permease subunit CysW [Thermoguttaceae bacterium]|nr:sulfate ABC transporter permease subunit CysW [Thermoguttaceae bacterium]